MVHVTRQADYAVRAVLYLAQRGPGVRTPTRQIARAQNIPLTFLAKIVAQLSAAGVLHAARGARGGVTLARPAKEISLLEVVEAIDGPLALNECTLETDCCPLGDDCPVRGVWRAARADLARRLSQTRFGRLAR